MHNALNGPPGEVCDDDWVRTILLQSPQEENCFLADLSTLSVVGRRGKDTVDVQATEPEAEDPFQPQLRG